MITINSVAEGREKKRKDKFATNKKSERENAQAAPAFCGDLTRDTVFIYSIRDNRIYTRVLQQF